MEPFSLPTPDMRSVAPRSSPQRGLRAQGTVQLRFGPATHFAPASQAEKPPRLPREPGGWEPDERAWFLRGRFSSPGKAPLHQPASVACRKSVDQSRRASSRLAPSRPRLREPDEWARPPPPPLTPPPARVSSPRREPSRGRGEVSKEAGGLRPPASLRSSPRGAARSDTCTALRAAQCRERRASPPLTAVSAAWSSSPGGEGPSAGPRGASRGRG